MVNKKILLLFDACRTGNLSYISNNLEFDYVNYCDVNNRTLLHIASLNNDTEMINTILKFLPDVNIEDKNNFLPVSYMIKNNNLECVKNVIENYNGVFTKEQLFLNLSIACMYDNVDIIKYLHKKLNFDANLLDSSKNTLLMIAAKFNSIKSYRFLIRIGSDQKAINVDGNNAMFFAITSNSYSIYQDLSKELDLNHRNNNGVTPLMTAVLYKRYNIINSLQSKKVNEFLKDYDGNNALHYAVMNDDDTSCMLLIDSNPSLINEQNFSGNTPFMISLIKNSELLAKLMLNYEIDFEIKNDNNKNAFELTWEKGNIKLAKMILSQYKNYKPNSLNLDRNKFIENDIEQICLENIDNLKEEINLNFDILSKDNNNNNNNIVSDDLSTDNENIREEVLVSTDINNENIIQNDIEKQVIEEDYEDLLINNDSFEELDPELSNSVLKEGDLVGDEEDFNLENINNLINIFEDDSLKDGESSNRYEDASNNSFWLSFRNNSEIQYYEKLFKRNLNIIDEVSRDDFLDEEIVNKKEIKFRDEDINIEINDNTHQNVNKELYIDTENNVDIEVENNYVSSNDNQNSVVSKLDFSPLIYDLEKGNNHINDLPNESEKIHELNITHEKITNESISTKLNQDNLVNNVDNEFVWKDTVNDSNNKEEFNQNKKTNNNEFCINKFIENGVQEDHDEIELNNIDENVNSYTNTSLEESKTFNTNNFNDNLKQKMQNQKNNDSSNQNEKTINLKESQKDKKEKDKQMSKSFSNKYNIKWLINKNEFDDIVNGKTETIFMDSQIKTTPIIYFAKIGKTKNIFEILKEDPKRINDRASNNKTALMYACQYNNLNCAKLLILVGARVNDVDDHKSTSLMYAAHMSNKEIVKLLLESGADANMKDINGLTALDIATRNEDKEIIDLLTSHKSDEVFTKTNKINLDQVEYI